MKLKKSVLKIYCKLFDIKRKQWLLKSTGLVLLFLNSFVLIVFEINFQEVSSINVLLRRLLTRLSFYLNTWNFYNLNMCSCKISILHKKSII